VSIDGVGAGGGSSILTPRMLGLPQWDGEDHSLTVFESLALAPDRAPSAPVPGQGAIGLLTVCAASGSRAEASARCERHPFARAEDMEGFGVALACAIARIPLSIVRGISNVAGERDVSRWQIGAALGAARQLALDHLGAREAPSGTSR
jgi:futalosine hydrolase